jgi:hypothetical protein
MATIHFSVHNEVNYYSFDPYMINIFDLEIRKYTSSENTRHSVTDTTDQQLSVTFSSAHGLEVHPGCDCA